MLTLCLLLQLFGDPLSLRYQREALPLPDWWRFLSANFIHLGWSHWLLNMCGLALVQALVGYRFSASIWCAVILVSCLGVSGGLFALNPKLSWYVGFSGALHGMLAAGALADTVSSAGRQKLFGMVILACVASKLLWEQLVGSLPGSASAAGGPVVVDSHLYGAVAGILAAATVLLFTVKKSHISR
ncbi:MAG: rhombosortase [Pseudomonadota bacterium]